MKSRLSVCTFAITMVAFLGTTSANSHRVSQAREPVQGVIDVLNLFPQVGALLIVGTANDVGFPVGIVAFCSGTLIHERAF